MSRSDIHENCITQNCRKLLEEEFIIQFVDINKIEDSRVLQKESKKMANRKFLTYLFLLFYLFRFSFYKRKSNVLK